MAYIDGTSGADNILGTNAPDTILGHADDDRISGLGGDDNIIGGSGGDNIDGGAGRDQANYQDSPSGVIVVLWAGVTSGGTAEGDSLMNIENLGGSEHNDGLAGDDNWNILYGRGGNDQLKGLGGDDVLAGELGDDDLLGGPGGDYMDGGAGFDTASYHTSLDGVLVSLLTGTGAYGDAEEDALFGIEGLIGSDHADTLGGDNSVNVIEGRAGSDTLKGFGGADILIGGIDEDTMIGGAGNDIYIVDGELDVVVESAGQGNDTVRTPNDYVLPDGADIETLETTFADGTDPLLLFGNSSSNVIIGNNGDNELWSGGGGTDRLIGRGGDDTYYVDHGGVQVVENGGQGIDRVVALASLTLTPGADVEILEAIDIGTNGIDLTGNANGNVVRGDYGANTLNGGDGRDELTGRSGQDQFLFNTPLDAATNVDVITDFTVTDDTVLLDNAIFSSLGLGTIPAGVFVTGAAAQDANDRIIYNSNTGALFYDNDGVGGNAQVQFATLSTGLALTNLDFLVVTGTQVAPLGGGRPFPADRTPGPIFADDAMAVAVIDLANLRSVTDAKHLDTLVW